MVGIVTIVFFATIAVGVATIVPQNSVKNSVFSRLCPTSLITFSEILQLMEGYILNIWNSLESILGLAKKFREMFRVFLIVSFQVKRSSADPLTHPE